MKKQKVLNSHLWVVATPLDSPYTEHFIFIENSPGQTALEKDTQTGQMEWGIRAGWRVHSFSVAGQQIPTVAELGSTHIHYPTVSRGQESGCTLAGASPQVSRATIKMLIKPGSYLEFGVLIQAHSGGWENSVSCSCITEPPNFSPAVSQGHLSAPRMHLCVVPCPMFP